MYFLGSDEIGVGKGFRTTLALYDARVNIIKHNAVDDATTDK